MAQSLLKTADGFMTGWAEALSSVRRKKPRFLVLNQSGSGYLYANGKPASPSDAALERQDILCRVEPDRLAWASFDIPAEALNHLNGIVRNKLSQLSPWDPDQIMHGYHVGYPSGTSKLRTVHVGMVEKTSALFSDGSGEKADNRRKVKSIHYEGQFADGTPVALHGAGLETGAHDESATAQARSVLYAMMVLAVVGAGAWFAVDHWYQSVSKGLTARTLEARKALQRYQQAQANQQDTGNVLALTKNGQPSKLVLMEAVARILPETTHVEQLQIGDGVVLLSGVSDDAANVLKAMADSNVFTDVRFVSPVLREKNGNRVIFQLEAKIGVDEAAVAGLRQVLATTVAN